jgi:hypothetical protein
MAVPALFDNCVLIYKMMDEQATDMTEGRMFEGSLTHMFMESELGLPAYGNVMKRLKRMNCVELVRRGGGGTPSRWLLITPPTIDRYEDAAVGTTKSQSAPIRADLEQRQRELHRRITQLEEWARSQGAPF